MVFINTEDKILQDTQHLNSEDKILHDTQNLNSVDEILQDTQNLNSEDEILHDTQNLNSEDKRVSCNILSSVLIKTIKYYENTNCTLKKGKNSPHTCHVSKFFT
jgi:hypothetical protein